MAESLALVWDLIARDNASGTFRKVGAEAEGASGAVGKLMGGFTALAAGGAIVVATKAAADFQAKMLLIQTQAGATSDEVRKMSPAILSLAGQVAQAPEALATSLYHVESTGLRGSAALDAVRVAAEGAKVGHADLEETTNALTATIASGMLPATETYTQAMGQLNTIVGSGDMKMSDLNEALGTGLLVTMKQYGVTVPDVGAALADFGDNNIRGADAATKLRMAVQAIESPAKTGKAALEKIGITSAQLAQDMATGGLNKALGDLHQHLVDSGIQADQWGQILTDAFTKKAGSGVLTLIGTFDRFQQKYQEVSDGANSFGDAWAATTKTANFQFAALGNSMEALGIKIGTAVLPYVTDLAQHINDFVNSQGFQDFLDKAGQSAVVTGHAVGGLVQGFMGLPKPIQEAAAALVLLRLADWVGWLDKLGAGAGKTSAAFRGFGSDVSTAASLAKQASIDLTDRIDAGRRFAVSATGEISQQSALTGSAVQKATANIMGLGGAAGEAASKGLRAFKAGASDLMGLFGGPWGVALVGATVGVGALQDAIQRHDDTIKKATDDVMAWNRAVSLNPGGKSAVDAQQHIADLQNQVDQYQKAVDQASNSNTTYGRTSGTAVTHLQELKDELAKGKKEWADQLAAMSPVEEMQARVDQATKDLTDAQKNNASNSPAVTNAAQRLQEAQHMLAVETINANNATKTQAQLQQDAANAMLASLDASRAAQMATLQFSDAVDQYNKDVADGQHSTRQLKEEQLGLVDSARRTAQAAADAADAQDKQNGITDTAKDRQAAFLKSLQDSANQMTGPGKQAILDMIAQLGKQQSQAIITSGAISGLGVTVTSLPSEHLIQINAPTQQQEKDLHDLGYYTTHLPNGQVVVTADTHPATDEINAMLQYARTQSILFRAGLAPITPGISGGGRMGGPATGGWIAGPGTGTSDTAGVFKLSHGEFVVNAAAASQHSQLLEAINGSGTVHTSGVPVLPGYATGGWIGPPANGSTAQVPVHIDQASLDAMRNGLHGLAQQAGSMFAGGGSAGGNPAMRALGQQIAANLGWASQFAAIDYIFSHESGWNPNAQNPTSTAYGIPQFLNGTWAAYGGKTSSPGLQITDGIQYMVDRYGSPNGAAAFWQAHHWYKDGTNYVPSDQLAVLHRGEAVIPAAQNQGAPYRDAGRSAPLIHIENAYDTTDLELRVRQAMFAESSYGGVF